MQMLGERESGRREEEKRIIRQGQVRGEQSCVVCGSGSWIDGGRTETVQVSLTTATGPMAVLAKETSFIARVVSL